MRSAKIIVGIAAALFVVAHLIEIPLFLERLRTIPDYLVPSVWGGKASGILIGLAVSIACFRSLKKKSE